MSAMNRCPYCMTECADAATRCATCDAVKEKATARPAWVMVPMTDSEWLALLGEEASAMPELILAAKLTLKCQELENQRDKAMRGHSSCCGVRDHWKAETMRLREAAQAVVDRWDTPLWKDVPATAGFINRLRKLLPENV